MPSLGPPRLVTDELQYPHFERQGSDETARPVFVGVSVSVDEAAEEHLVRTVDDFVDREIIAMVVEGSRRVHA